MDAAAAAAVFGEEGGVGQPTAMPLRDVAALPLQTAPAGVKAGEVSQQAEAAVASQGAGAAAWRPAVCSHPEEAETATEAGAEAAAASSRAEEIRSQRKQPLRTAPWAQHSQYRRSVFGVKPCQTHY